MTDIETIKNFMKYISVNSKKDDHGKVRLDSTVIRKLVANDPETSAAVVGLYCKMAKEDPMYFQLASIIAAAYNIEFDDDTLMVTVRQAQTPPGSKPMPPLGFQPEKGKNQ